MKNNVILLYIISELFFKIISHESNDRLIQTNSLSQNWIGLFDVKYGF